MEESIKKEKVCLQHLSDLNLDAISAQAKDSKSHVSFQDAISKDSDEKLQISGTIPKTDKVAAKRVTADLRFDLNPFNRCITIYDMI